MIDSRLLFEARLTPGSTCNIVSYMKRDSRLSAVLHALLHMAERTEPMTSEELALCLSTNPVVVRRTMGLLREAGLVASARGHSGGWHIKADLSKVSLRQLHAALGEPALFAMGNRHENPACLVEQAVNAALNDAFDDAEALLLERFASVSLADLAADFARRHKAHLEKEAL
jgi:DNA-binding IscR family transcriptional regulator